MHSTYQPGLEYCFEYKQVYITNYVHLSFPIIEFTESLGNHYDDFLACRKAVQIYVKYL